MAARLNQNSLRCKATPAPPARSSMSTWTLSMRRSNSAMTRASKASRSRSAGAIAAWSLRRATKRGRWRALRHAVGHRQAAVPGADLRQAAVRRLSRGVAADPRDLRRLYRPRRTAEPRRSLSRRDRGPARPRQRARDRRGHPPPHPRGDAGLPRRRASPIASSSPSSPPITASPTACASSRPRAGPNSSPRFRSRASTASARSLRARWSGWGSSPAPTSGNGAWRRCSPVRKLGSMVLAYLPRNRRARGQARPALQIGQRRAHVRRGSARSRTARRRARADRGLSPGTGSNAPRSPAAR